MCGINVKRAVTIATSVWIEPQTFTRTNRRYLNVSSECRWMKRNATHVQQQTQSPIFIDRSHCSSVTRHENTKTCQNIKPPQASLSKSTCVEAALLQRETKTPISFHNRPSPCGLALRQNKSAGHRRQGRPEAHDSSAPVTGATNSTHAACARCTQLRARPRTGRASSNGVHAHPPRTRFSQPRCLSAADSHSPVGRNLPPLSRSRVAQHRVGTATKK